MAYDNKENKTEYVSFHLTAEEQKAREETYAVVDELIKVRDLTYRQFGKGQTSGDRTLIQYIDDGDKRLNGYVLTREEQNKESWQANLFDNVTRQKMRAFVAGVALNLPEIDFSAVNKSGLFSAKRAELMKQLVRHSRIVGGNPQMEAFFEVWEALGKGTVIKYDGYLKTQYKRKTIKAYDPITGAIEFEEREEIIDDKPIDILIPLSELYISDFYIDDVQDQPEIVWVQKYNKSQIEHEFSKFKNYKFIRSGYTIAQYAALTDTYFYQKWGQRVSVEVDREDYEVVRRYCKYKDKYEVWINGVPMLRAPLVWGKKRKVYPFSKMISEPFEGRKFFYGKSFPDIMMGVQDVNNTLVNSILDKAYRSLKRPMLVGMVNKDLMDIEDEFVDQDNKIYVPDVDQVKPMPFEGITNGDIAILEVIARRVDLASFDANQQGVQGQGVTAREVVIADERARQLKGIVFMFLEDLWLQKTRLRVTNVLMNYMIPKLEKVIGADGAQIIQEALNIINIPNTPLSDGSMGTLGVQIQSSPDDRKILRKKGIVPQDLFSVPQIESREMAMNMQGMNYKLVSTTTDYLDDWEFDFVVAPASLNRESDSKKRQELTERQQIMAALFPEYLATNKEVEFKKFVESYGGSTEEYQPPAPQPTPPQEQPVQQ